MDIISSVPHYVIPFLVVLSILVFIHEFGHYVVARLCGVRVKIFSIGFGPELFGFNSKSGTRWKFSLIPLGGFVQMYGDSDPASSANQEEVEQIPDEEKRYAFYYKNVWQRICIVFAGPGINFIYAILVMAVLFCVQGRPYTPPVIGGIVENSAAAQGGFEPGDRILSVNGESIARFEDLKRLVTVNLDSPIDFKIQRKDKEIHLNIKPEVLEEKDARGFTQRIGRLGVFSAGKIAVEEQGIGQALLASVEETWSITTSTLHAMGQIIAGDRSTKELGGVIRIGAYAKDFSDRGIAALIMFSAIISINLGLINLFPIPLLDGGHIVFFLYEAVARRKLPEKVQRAAYGLGYAFIILLMLYATWNDLVQLKVIDYLVKLVS